MGETGDEEVPGPHRLSEPEPPSLGLSTELSGKSHVNILDSLSLEGDLVADEVLNVVEVDLTSNTLTKCLDQNAHVLLRELSTELLEVSMVFLFFSRDA